jgi:hypothetical protein
MAAAQYSKMESGKRNPVITILVVAVLAFIIIAPFVSLTTSRNGDLVDDPHSTVERRGDRCRIVVTNPAATLVVVGLGIRDVRFGALSSGRPDLTIRPARWYEHCQLDRGADIVLGVVDGNAEQVWDILIPQSRVRIVLVLGRPANRLQIHDHRVPAKFPPERLHRRSSGPRTVHDDL